MTERINDTDADGATHETAIENVCSAASLFAGYASACNGGAVMHPGDFFDYPERLKAAADSYELLLSALRAARRELDTMRAALQQIADGSTDPDDWEPYDEYHEPVDVDTSNCGDWHDHGCREAHWQLAKVARKALSSVPPILERNDRG